MQSSYNSHEKNTYILLAGNHKSKDKYDGVLLLYQLWITDRVLSIVFKIDFSWYFDGKSKSPWFKPCKGYFGDNFGYAIWINLYKN